jgi:ferric iron reductase protein FhuF
MKLIQTLLPAALCITSASAFAFSPNNCNTFPSMTHHHRHANTHTRTAIYMISSTKPIDDHNHNNNNNQVRDRRAILSTFSNAFAAAMVANTVLSPMNAHAISGVSVAEFETILKTSGASCDVFVMLWMV